MDKKTLGYEKVIKIGIVSFVLLFLGFMIIANLWFIESAVFKRSEDDINVVGNVMDSVNALNDEISHFESNLKTQARMIGYVLSNEAEYSSNQIDNLVYDSNQRVSLTDPGSVVSDGLSGNVVLKGEVEDITELQKEQINRLGDFYPLADSLLVDKKLSYSVIYYSVEDYLVYYPYQSNESSVVAYYGVFESVKDIASQIYDFSTEEQKQVIENGWNQINFNEESNIITINKTYPIIVDNKITGILVGHMTDEEVQTIIGNTLVDTDVYLISKEMKLIYSSVADVDKQLLFSEISQTEYDVRYYDNQFPIPVEVREEVGHRYYIGSLNKDGWHLVFVQKDNFIENYGSTIVFNVLVALAALIVIFFVLRFSSKEHNQLATKAEQSKFDSMTELLNHKHIIVALERYLSNKRMRQITVMMIDIDHFKLVNDTYGHAVGDKVIITTARAIEDVLNNYVGVVGRYGGEEFMAILPRMEKLLAFEIADRIRLDVAQAIMAECEIEKTISVGVHFETMPTKKSAAELINAADENLYYAKEHGRNQVVKSEDDVKDYQED